MQEEYDYERLVTGFNGKRHELLEMINSIVPRPSELHRRRWRVQQLENTIGDLKATVTACNNQLDTERARLDELNGESSRLRAQEQKLTEDLRILQGVTGMATPFARDARSPALAAIEAMAERFRARFANFFFDLPPIRQSLPLDPTLARDAQVLVATMEDFIRLQFDARAADAGLSREAAERTAAAEALEVEVRAREQRLAREIEQQRRRLTDSAARMRENMDAQAAELKREGARINAEYEQMLEDLRRSTEGLALQEERLRGRCLRLEAQQRSLRAAAARRVAEVARELDAFERRVAMIRAEPRTADRALVNLSLLLADRAGRVEDAVAEMRREIGRLARALR
jgi:chromosome segregation ATPase